MIEAVEVSDSIIWDRLIEDIAPVRENQSDGETTPEIAERLGVSTSTVRFYLRKAMRNGLVYRVFVFREGIDGKCYRVAAYKRKDTAKTKQ